MGTTVLWRLFQEINEKREISYVKKTLNEADVQGKIVLCHSNKINAVLDTPYNQTNEYITHIKKTLDTLKEWLAHIIVGRSAPTLIAQGSKIERNIWLYWRDTCSGLLVAMWCLYKNECITQHPKYVLVVSISERENGDK